MRLWLAIVCVFTLVTPGARSSIAAATDQDGDNVDDGIDNCPMFANPDQADNNFDGIGDGCGFTIVDLGTLGGAWSQAFAINDAGQVVGLSETADGFPRAFSWTASSGMVDLGTLGGTWSEAYFVNAAGHVIGTSETADGAQHAFSWIDGTLHDLGTLGGPFSEPRAVNASGQVVGGSETSDGSFRAFIWTPGGQMVDLGVVGYALAISDTGQVVGEDATSRDGSRGSRAFSWTAETGIVDLGSLGGRFTAAWAVADTGQVAGWSNVVLEGREAQHAFSWTEADGMIDLGTFGAPHSTASAVNERGQIAGILQWRGGQSAFSWTADEGMTDIGVFVDAGVHIAGLNDNGQIAGTMDYLRIPPHAFAWSAARGLFDLGTLDNTGAASGALGLNAHDQVVGWSYTPDNASQHAVLWTPVWANIDRRENQTIAFEALADRSYGDPASALIATASSGLSVNFDATGNCTISDGTLRLTGAGQCTVTASQAGDADFHAAPSVSHTFAIAKAAAQITVTGGTFTYDGQAHGLTGTATGINGEDLSDLFDLGEGFTNVPGGTAAWIFVGNTNYANDAGAVAILIEPAATTTTVASSANPARSNDPLIFTATISVVAPGGGAPDGIVEFVDGMTVMGVGSVAAARDSFVVTLSTTLSGGDHTITARYVSGSVNHQTSTSPAISQTVFGRPAQPGPPANPGPPDTVPGNGPPDKRGGGPPR